MLELANKNGGKARISRNGGVVHRGIMRVAQVLVAPAQLLPKSKPELEVHAMANSNLNRASAPVAIYLLKDIAGVIRYVGQSINPKKRFVIHKWSKKWPVEYEVIEWVPQSEWKQREIYWIWKYSSDGHPLCNRTIGGEGAVGLSADAQKKRSESLRRAWLKRDRAVSAETKEKISLANRGKVVPPEVRVRISKGMKGLSTKWLTGRKPSPESIAKRTAKQRGMKRSDESRRRYAESKRGDRNPQAGKRPWNYGLKGFRAGRVVSDVTKQRLRDAHSKRRAMRLEETLCLPF